MFNGYSKDDEMLSSKIIMVIYRVIAVLLLSMPMAINILIQGNIVSSIVYVPLITLALSGIAIYIDGKLAVLLSRNRVLPTFKVPTTNLHVKTTNDLMI
jgi:hypothetical protein